MKNSTLIAEIRKNTKQILNCEDDFYLMKLSADNLYKIFSEVSGIYIDLNNDHEIRLPTGKAISPASAAHCLLEFKRTAIFLRGIQKAIDKKKFESNSPVEILYAGCGPYATLISPLLSLYHSSELHVTLLDVNQVSLSAVENLIEELGFQKYIDNFILTDATKFKFAADYDIVISETMQACLENEPMVHIMNNLIPQMKPDAIFIPEEVSVDIYLSDPKLFKEHILAENIGKNIAYKKFVDHFIRLNKHNFNKLGDRKRITIPLIENNFKELILDTFITVFEDEQLKERECSLNCSRQFYDLSVQEIEQVEFYLDYQNVPKVNCKVLSP